MSHSTGQNKWAVVYVCIAEYWSGLVALRVLFKSTCGGLYPGWLCVVIPTLPDVACRQVIDTALRMH